MKIEGMIDYRKGKSARELGVAFLGKALSGNSWQETQSAFTVIHLSEYRFMNLATFTVWPADTKVYNIRIHDDARLVLGPGRDADQD